MAATLAPTSFLGATTLKAPLALRPLSHAAAPAAPARRSALRVSFPRPPLHLRKFSAPFLQQGRSSSTPMLLLMPLVLQEGAASSPATVPIGPRALVQAHADPWAP